MITATCPKGQCVILIKMLLNSNPKGPVDNKSALVQVVVWCQTNVDEILQCLMASISHTKSILLLSSCSFCYLWKIFIVFVITHLSTFLKIFSHIINHFPPVGSGTPAFRLGSRIDPHHHRGVVKVHWRVPWVGGLFSWVVATFTL